MKELLMRWSRLEPERCMSGPPTTHICVVVQVGDIDIFHDGAHTVMLDRPSAKQRALLLAAVIEAIEARGWLWQMGRLPNGNHWARVWDRGPDGEHVDRMNCAEGDPYRKEDSAPVAALLGAYLAALEAADADEPETARFTAALKAENETLRAAVLNIANTLSDTNGETNQ